jgi:excisionase family DNA binding protein
MTKLLSPKEFASDLNITVSCVRRWIGLRKINVVHVGRLVRIPAEERERIVREGLVPARTQQGGPHAQ